MIVKKSAPLLLRISQDVPVQGTGAAESVPSVQRPAVAASEERNEAKSALPSLGGSGGAGGAQQDPSSVVAARSGAWRTRKIEGLKIIDGVRPADLLMKLADPAFRPTLVGRMDNPAPRATLVSSFFARLLEQYPGSATVVGSSTLTAGSPDQMMNEVTGDAGLPMVRVNRESYLHADGQLVAGARSEGQLGAPARKAFEAAPHYTWATAAEYGDALKVIANVVVLMGGRDVALREFKNAIDAQHAVLLLETPSEPDSEKAWDADRVVNGVPSPRTDDAVRYLKHQLQVLDDGRLADLFPPVSGVDQSWLASHREEIRRLTTVVPVDVAPHTEAIAAATAHLHKLGVVASEVA